MADGVEESRRMELSVVSILSEEQSNLCSVINHARDVSLLTLKECLRIKKQLLVRKGICTRGQEISPDEQIASSLGSVKSHAAIVFSLALKEGLRAVIGIFPLEMRRSL